MPFYSKLRINEKDNQASQRKKKRTARKLNQIKEDIQQHFIASDSALEPEMSVRIATWNIRKFGQKGRDFESLYYIAEIISHFDIIALQEIVGDLTGRSDFGKLMKIMGPDWEYIASDVTDGNAGNGERMVFVYNHRRVHFKNIVGELTLAEGGKIRAAFGERMKVQGSAEIVTPDAFPTLTGVYDARLATKKGKKHLAEDLEIDLPKGSTLKLPDGCKVVLTKGMQVTSPGRGKAKVTLPRKISGTSKRLRFPGDTLDDSLRQFARTPYLIAFQAGWLKLNLCTVHIYYGSTDHDAKLEQRRKEIELLTSSLADKAEGELSGDPSSFMGVLGDFNIVGKDHPTMAALESSGFEIPESLKKIPGSNVAKDKAYDQIAFWKPRRNRGFVKLEILGSGVFDFFETVYPKDEEAEYRKQGQSDLKTKSKYTTWRTHEMSDHLPMWIELKTDFSEAYLKAVEEAD